MTPATIGVAASVALFTYAVAEAAASATGPIARPGGRLRALASATPVRFEAQYLGRLCQRAGVSTLSGADLAALKSACGLIAAACLVPSATVVGTVTAVVLSVIAAGLMFMAPDVWLYQRVRARRQRLQLELPGVLDLMSVAVSAGLPIGSAMDETARRLQGLLATELRAAGTSVELGHSRAEALALLQQRCPHEGVAAFVAAITRSDRHGVPLAPALAAIARQARVERARAVREQAARAAPKVQLVIALGLVPATMLLLAAGLISAWA